MCIMLTFVYIFIYTILNKQKNKHTSGPMTYINMKINIESDFKKLAQETVKTPQK